MLLYFDMCAVKRPFDDQSQPRVALETTAVLALVAAVHAGHHTALRSTTLDAENENNPHAKRRSSVQAWLNSLPLIRTPISIIESRASELIRLGAKPQDAMHLSWSENAGADVFVTTDDGLLALSKRPECKIRVRVIDPITLVRELAL